MSDLHYLPLILSFLLIPLALIVIKSARNQASNLPPSPWKLPFIGNIHQLIGALPHRALHKLSNKYGPIMHLKLGQVDHIIISGPEAAREILKTQDLNFASRPQLTAPTIVFYDSQDIVFSPYGPLWRQLRKICVLELLNTRRVKSFSHIREAENSALIKAISTSGGKTPVNLSENLLLLANTIIARASFGPECKKGPGFVAELKEAAKLMSGFHIPDFYPSAVFLSDFLGTGAKLKSVRSHIDRILDEIITDHRARKSTEQHGKEEKDLLSVLLRIKEQGGLELPLSMIHVKAVITDVFSAGTDTTVSVLVWAMAELMRHPAMMEKAQLEVRHVAKGKHITEEVDVKELQFMKLVIKETMRLHPPAPLLVPRQCRERCKVAGFDILEGTRVFINAWAIARDPKYWEDAESFKPERFEGLSDDFVRESFHYLPFGGGRRMCPGMEFGMASVELTLAHLLFHFDWELPGGMKPEDLDMTECIGIAATRKLDLCLIATPRLFSLLLLPSHYDASYMRSIGMFHQTLFFKLLMETKA